jgi:hypothetical protein
VCHPPLCTGFAQVKLLIVYFGGLVMKVLTESEDVQLRLLLNRVAGCESTLDLLLEEIRELKEGIENILKIVKEKC